MVKLPTKIQRVLDSILGPGAHSPQSLLIAAADRAADGGAKRETTAVAVLGMDEALVEAVLDDWRTAPVEPRFKAALGFLEKLTRTPDELTGADIRALRAAGLSHTAIREAGYVAFLFGVMDRLADAFDFHIPTEPEVRAIGRFLNQHGYTASKRIR